MPLVEQVAVCLLMVFTAVVLSMDQYDLVFNTDSLTPHALHFNPYHQRFSPFPKKAFTFCFYAFLKNKPGHSIILVSYSSRDISEPSEVHFEVNYNAEPYCAISILGSSASFPQAPKPKEWTHLCASWNSTSGETILFMNGARVGRTVKAVKQGAEIEGNGYLVLGQDQDTFDGGQSETQGVLGRMTHFNLWDRELSAREVNESMRCALYGEVIEWDISTWRFFDGIMVQISTAPCDRPLEELQKVPCKNTVHSSISQYDLKDGFDDRFPTVVTASPKDVSMPDMKELTYCFVIYNAFQQYDLQVIDYKTEEGESIITFGYMRKLDAVYAGIKHVGAVLGSHFSPNISKQYCVTWSGTTGILKWYYVGRLQSTHDETSKDYVIPGNGRIIITQEQSSPLNESYPNKGFTYKASDFYLWKRLLSDEEVAKFYADTCSVKDYLISPSGTKWDVKKRGCPEPYKESPIEIDDAKAFEKKHTVHVKAVLIKPMLHAKKNAFTFCAWIYNEVKHQNVEHFFTVGNISLSSTDNGIAFACGKERHSFSGNFFPDSWHHFCMTWSGNDGGATEIFVDRRRKLSFTDFATDQESVLDGWKTLNIQHGPAVRKRPDEGFSWKVADVNVWDYVLPEEEVKRVSKCALFLGNVINARTSAWKEEDK